MGLPWLATPGPARHRISCGPTRRRRVGFELDGDDILIGSYQNLAGSRKYKNVAAGGEQVSLIVDSLASVDPMEPVAVKIHGTAVDRAAQRPVWTNGIHRRPAADDVELGRRGAGLRRREFQPHKALSE